MSHMSAKALEESERKKEYADDMYKLLCEAGDEFECLVDGIPYQREDLKKLLTAIDRILGQIDEGKEEENA